MLLTSDAVYVLWNVDDPIRDSSNQMIKNEEEGKNCVFDPKWSKM